MGLMTGRPSLKRILQVESLPVPDVEVTNTRYGVAVGHLSIMFHSQGPPLARLTKSYYDIYVWLSFCEPHCVFVTLSVGLFV